MIKAKDEELKNVTGGMKIVVIKSPKFIQRILKLIFKDKKSLDEKDLSDLAGN